MIHIPNIMLNFFLTAYTFWSLPSTVCRYIQGLGHLHKQSYIPANVKHEIINNSEFLSIIHLYLVPYTHIQVCIPKNQQHLCRKYSSMNLKGIARPTMQKKRCYFSGNVWDCSGYLSHWSVKGTCIRHFVHDVCDAVYPITYSQPRATLAIWTDKQKVSCFKHGIDWHPQQEGFIKFIFLWLLCNTNADKNFEKTI